MPAAKQQNIKPENLLGGVSAEHFLKDYWQKKPLLIRQAIPDYSSPISPDELAGLAMEEDVESRIIIEKEENAHWTLHRGPFDSDTFAHLPASHWTLLIQQLDAWAPEINALKQRFSFIPNWRIDDIMASYAPVGGSVGPHFDQYDVFLLQAHGKRLWQTGQQCDGATPLLDNTDLSILEHFETENEWLLEPGDMLYLPPGLAHFGVAQNECITLSVGFRAPSEQQILSSATDFILEHSSKERLFSDPGRPLQDSAGELSSSDKKALKAMLLASLTETAQMDHWLVRFCTETKNPMSLGEAEHIEADELRGLITSGAIASKNEGSRFVYTLSQEVEPAKCIVGVDGQSWELPIEELPIIQQLCDAPTLSLLTLADKDDNTAIFRLVMTLFCEGSLYC